VLDGGSPDERYPTPTYVRDYLLASKFGYTKQQIDEQPAVWLDWILAIDGEVIESKNEQSKG
jgi:hypothetical protein